MSSTANKNIDLREGHELLINDGEQWGDSTIHIVMPAFVKTQKNDEWKEKGNCTTWCVSQLQGEIVKAKDITPDKFKQRICKTCLNKAAENDINNESALGKLIQDH